MSTTCCTEINFDLTISSPIVTSSLEICQFTNSALFIETIGTYTFATASTLPLDLVLNEDGTITGIANEIGLFNLDIVATEVGNPSNIVNKTIPLNVYPTPVLNYTLPSPIVRGVPVSFTLDTQIIQDVTVTWNVVNLPAGLSTTPSVNTKILAITGTPTTADTSAVSITATTEHGCSDVAEFDAIVYLPIVANCFIGTACLNEVYNSVILIQDGTLPYVITNIANIPPGLELIATDINSNPSIIILQGIATVAGAYIVTYTITDANGVSITKYCPVNIIDCGSGQGSGGPLGNLISLPSNPIVVEDPFHQKHLSGMLPSPYEK